MDCKDFLSLDELKDELNDIIMSKATPSITVHTTVCDDRDQKDVSENLVGKDFSEKLSKKSGSTSTPILPRTRSGTELTGAHQDSGFNEIFSLTYHHETTQEQSLDNTTIPNNVMTDQSQSEPQSQTDSGYGGSQLCTTSLTSESQHISSQEEPCQPDSGLNRLHEYYSTLNKICSLDKVIGKRIGVDHIDIITELSSLHIPCLRFIFRLLSDWDLARCRKVSMSWNQAVMRDKHIIARIKSLEKISAHVGKENTSPTKEEPASSSHISRGVPLSSINVTMNNTSPTESATSSPENSNDSSLFKRFTKEAQKLKVGEKLVKCVRCSAPAKLYSEARKAHCTRSSCKYDFCTICELEYHGARECITQPNKKTRVNEQPINSKRSKKQLRRLL